MQLLKSQQSEVVFKKELSDKIFDTFMPRKNGLCDLVQKGSKEKLDVNITVIGSNKYKQPIYFSFGDRTEKSISTCMEHVEPLTNSSINALFVPAKEVLTAFTDIRNIRENFYCTGFDDTYSYSKRRELQNNKNVSLCLLGGFQIDLSQTISV